MTQNHIQTALMKAYLLRRIEEEVAQETKLRNLRLAADAVLMQKATCSEHIQIGQPNINMTRTQLFANETFRSANMSLPSPATSTNAQNLFSTQTTDKICNDFFLHLDRAQNQCKPYFTVEQFLDPPSVASLGSYQSSSASILDPPSVASLGSYQSSSASSLDPPSVASSGSYQSSSASICSFDEAPKPSSDRKSKKSSRSPKSFNDHLQSLIAFKEIYGHCNVPHRSKEHRSLGNWCNNIRTSWRIVKEGGEPASYKLKRDQIEQLDKIGFKWRLYSPRSRQRKKSKKNSLESLC